jgi:hypothetical protein
VPAHEVGQGLKDAVGQAGLEGVRGRSQFKDEFVEPGTARRAFADQHGLHETDRLAAIRGRRGGRPGSLFGQFFGRFVDIEIL